MTVDQLGLLWNRLPALMKAGELGLHSKINTDRVAQPSRNPDCDGQISVKVRTRSQSHRDGMDARTGTCRR